ncbi:MAG: hypothetical protein FJ361_01275 [Gemmatimonadetes bacterium]|nr:hypothetical protein [Gemmatimonadota bacterium]
MLTAHAAATLLDGLAGSAPLATLLPPLGFPAARRLDRVTRERLGLTDGAWEASLAIAGSRRRAAVVDASDAAVVRAQLVTLTQCSGQTAVRTGKDLRGIALARTTEGERLIGVRRGADRRWRATEDPRRLRRWVGSVGRFDGKAISPTAAIAEVRRAVARYLARSAWRSEAVESEVPPPDLTRLRRRLDAIVTRAPALERHARWLARAAGRLEAGRADRLHAALRTREEAPFLRAIADCFADDAPSPAASPARGAPRLIATLVVLPQEPTP